MSKGKAFYGAFLNYQGKTFVVKFEGNKVTACEAVKKEGGYDYKEVGDAIEIEPCKILPIYDWQNTQYFRFKHNQETIKSKDYQLIKTPTEQFSKLQKIAAERLLASENLLKCLN
jgi:hypothetical protein